MQTWICHGDSQVEWSSKPLAVQAWAQRRSRCWSFSGSLQSSTSILDDLTRGGREAEAGPGPNSESLARLGAR